MDNSVSDTIFPLHYCNLSNAYKLKERKVFSVKDKLALIIFIFFADLTFTLFNWLPYWKWHIENFTSIASWNHTTMILSLFCFEKRYIYIHIYIFIYIYIYNIYYILYTYYIIYNIIHIHYIPYCKHVIALK